MDELSNNNTDKQAGEAQSQSDGGGDANAERARKLEQKLASIQRRKQQARARANAPAVGLDVGAPAAKNPAEPSEADDKTQFQPRVSQADAAVETHAQAPAPSDSDKTQFQPRPERPLSGDDATQFMPRAAQLENDATQFMPRAGLDDKTQFHARSSEAAPASDVTQFQPSAAPAQAGSNPSGAVEDATEQPNLGLLKKRFVLEKVLGAGGMGVVYKAKDLLKVEAQDRDPYVAVKVLGEEFKTHPEAFIALQRESRKSQNIAHPNIVNVFDFDKDGDLVFMTMEYLEGQPLDQFISQYRSIGLPRDDIWRILQGICAALSHAHDQEIVHSDFKPGNIFYTNKGVAKVFDFGIARAVKKAENLEDSVDDKTVFDAGTLGAITPAYASLEMIEGEVPDVRDDIYALGCIAYELFTGEHPYKRMNARDAKEAGVKAKRIPGISSRQWKTIEKAIAFKREDRIATVDQFWQQLTQKRSLKFVWFAAFVLSLMAAAFAWFQYQASLKVDDGFNADEFRSEVERELRIEMMKKNVGEFLEHPRFDESWELELWREIQVARALLPKDDPWLAEYESKAYAQYISHISEAIEAARFEGVDGWLINAERYTDDNSLLEQLATNLAQERQAIAQAKAAREAQQKQQAAKKAEQQKQQKAIAERRDAYNFAMENVERQLDCRANINMNDVSTAIQKLRALDAARFRSDETKITKSLALCLQSVGRSYPDRARQSKKVAMDLFPGNREIASVKIVDRDPCTRSIAGLGARGERTSCRDRIPRVGQGPTMVVVPAMADGNMFAIGKFEVSVADFNAYCVASGSCQKLAEQDSSLPATNISKKQMDQYLRWLSSETKYRYRLPTQAEWLYAAKAGRASLDPNRNCKLSSRGIEKGGELLKASIGKKNAWGLVNVLGNAQEVVRGRGRSYLSLGGSHSTAMADCNFDYQQAFDGSANELTGFRVLRELRAGS
ncbi:bifunctional serine/threonine-protein kinase/formylglycine-generating enzyme family protein [Agaribacterium haliotis]|uniref:bifunctional serine/threonine-protein kinase/formylglycine-generating enzyme family protein n=1 Tax=Agaribacterium haliotis TaxID=2013869 RepID=UPI000BB57E7B|nr:bifunctional serine/threonine-protein kinase/formylglycine-generating enzyme family protein [Agaribacterium haliotis]